MLLDRLKRRIKSACNVFTDSELQGFIDDAINDFGLIEGQDDRLILDIAEADVYKALASDTARYFKYRELSEEVDKTHTPEMFLKLYTALWSSIEKRLPQKFGKASLKRGT